MPRPLKQGILGASTTILSKNIDKHASMCGSNFNETDVRNAAWKYVLKSSCGILIKVDSDHLGIKLSCCGSLWLEFPKLYSESLPTCCAVRQPCIT